MNGVVDNILINKEEPAKTKILLSKKLSKSRRRKIICL